jgi:CubicO group peptidase (beta-lactamase class C family)
MAATAALTAEVEPEEVGLDPERLVRLDSYLDGYVANGRLKGSLLLITRGGRVAHVSRRGHRDADAGLAVEPDTIWRIYSMTKPITSVAAMMLYEEGALSLCSPDCRSCSSRAPSGTTRWPPTWSAGSSRSSPGSPWTSSSHSASSSRSA